MDSFNSYVLLFIAQEFEEIQTVSHKLIHDNITVCMSDEDLVGVIDNGNPT